MLKVIEPLVVVLTIIQYSADWVALLLSGGISEGDGLGYSNLSLNVFLNVSTYLWAVCFLILRWKKTIYYITHDRIIWPMLAIAFASILWSYDPRVTLNACINFLGVTLFGLYIGSNYSVKEQVKLVGISYLIILVSSLLFIIALPRYGIMGGIHSGAWRGITTHKNGFGRILALGFPILFMLKDAHLIKNWLIYSAIALTSLNLAMNRSTGAMLIAIVLLISIPVYNVFRLSFLQMLLGLLGLTVSSSLLYFIYLQNAETLFSFLGKDPTLTGRTDIWAAVWQVIQEHLWLGYGLDAFWRLGLDGPAGYVMRVVGWEMPNSHNAWLDLWLNLGLIGVLTYSIGFGVNLLRALRLAHNTSGLDGLWPLILLTFILISAIAEGGLIDNRSWVLYTATSFGISKFYIETSQNGSKPPTKSAENFIENI